MMAVKISNKKCHARRWAQGQACEEWVHAQLDGGRHSSTEHFSELTGRYIVACAHNKIRGG
eukprot:3730608-Amphidinium_carterae.7